MEQVSRLHGTASYRKCSCFAMKLGKLDAYENLKIVHWCRTQASNHKLQGVVDGRVNEAGTRTAATYRRAVLRC